MLPRDSPLPEQKGQQQQRHGKACSKVFLGRWIQKSGHLDPLENESFDWFGLGLRGKERDLCCTTKRFGHVSYPGAVVGSREWKLRVWEFRAPCLLSDRSLHLFIFPGIKIRETIKEPQYSSWDSPPSLTLQGKHLISLVHGTKQQTVLQKPGVQVG